VYVDQYLEDGRSATALYSIDSNGLNVFETEDYNLKLLTKRTSDKLLCGVSPSNKKILIPTETPPREDILFPEIWKYWYDVYDGKPKFSLAAFVNNDFSLNVGIPDSWLDKVTYSFDEKEKLFVFYEAETGEVYLEIKVLSVGESPDKYVENGFETVETRSGAYRYYLRCERTFSEKSFIKYNFFATE
jgi:hypothetical protein